MLHNLDTILESPEHVAFVNAVHAELDGILEQHGGTWPDDLGHDRESMAEALADLELIEEPARALSDRFGLDIEEIGTLTEVAVEGWIDGRATVQIANELG